MQFEMKKRNYIVCPQCKIRIQCRKCKCVSDELYEETGYFPDLNKDTISYHVKSLHDMQQENKEK